MAYIWGQQQDFYTYVRVALRKILISYSSNASMRRGLELLGMTKAFLLPDLIRLDKSGLARTIVQSEQLRFVKSFARWKARIEGGARAPILSQQDRQGSGSPVAGCRDSVSTGRSACAAWPASRGSSPRVPSLAR